MDRLRARGLRSCCEPLGVTAMTAATCMLTGTPANLQTPPQGHASTSAEKKAAPGPALPAFSFKVRVSDVRFKLCPAYPAMCAAHGMHGHGLCAAHGMHGHGLCAAHGMHGHGLCAAHGTHGHGLPHMGTVIHTW
jgi:hypothetical protein